MFGSPAKKWISNGTICNRTCIFVIIRYPAKITPNQDRKRMARISHQRGLQWNTCCNFDQVWPNNIPNVFSSYLTFIWLPSANVHPFRQWQPFHSFGKKTGESYFPIEEYMLRTFFAIFILLDANTQQIVGILHKRRQFHTWWYAFRHDPSLWNEGENDIGYCDLLTWQENKWSINDRRTLCHNQLPALKETQTTIPDDIWQKLRFSAKLSYVSL